MFSEKRFLIPLSVRLFPRRAMPLAARHSELGVAEKRLLDALDGDALGGLLSKSVSERSEAERSAVRSFSGLLLSSSNSKTVPEHPDVKLLRTSKVPFWRERKQLLRSLGLKAEKSALGENELGRLKTVLTYLFSSEQWERKL